MSKVDGVGVMKDKEIKFEEIETSHTLGGEGEGRGEGIDDTLLSYPPEMHQSHGCSHNMSGCVDISDTPMYMYE